MEILGSCGKGLSCFQLIVVWEGQPQLGLTGGQVGGFVSLLTKITQDSRGSPKFKMSFGAFRILLQGGTLVLGLSFVFQTSSGWTLQVFEFGSSTAVTTFFFLSSVCLALLLLAVLEHISVSMQSPRKTIEKVLFAFVETEGTSNVSLACAHLMGGSSHSLSISY